MTQHRACKLGIISSDLIVLLCRLSMFISDIDNFVTLCFFNHNTFTGVVGKVQKIKLFPQGGRKGGWRKKACGARRPAGSGARTRTYRVLGEGPQLHAMGVV